MDTISSIVNDSLKQYVRVRPQEDLNKEKQQRLKNYVDSALQKIISFFDFKNTLSLNIADAYLYFEDDNGKKYKWGKAMECSEKSCFFAIDTSFWNTSNLIHEMIHPFNKYLPSRNDKSYYLFNESMVEYLAICFGYENLQTRDSIFEEKINFFDHLDTEVI